MLRYSTERSIAKEVERARAVRVGGRCSAPGPVRGSHSKFHTRRPSPFAFTRRDHGLRVDDQRLGEVSSQLKTMLSRLLQETDLDSLRGVEGASATAYFGVFDQMILGDRSVFHFETRSRRPPLIR